jgi:hypothetical protein
LVPVFVIYIIGTRIQFQVWLFKFSRNNNLNFLIIVQKFIHKHTGDSKNVQMNKGKKKKKENLQDVKLAHTNLVLVIRVPKIKSKWGFVFMNWKSRIRTSSSNLPNRVKSNNHATQANYYGRPSLG